MVLVLPDELALERDLQAATSANLHDSTSIGHEMQPLFLSSEQCEHADPAQDARFASLLKLRRDYLRELTHYDSHDAFQAAYDAHPLADEYEALRREYDDVHVGTVCTQTSAGDFCGACTEGDDDYGFEDAPCLRSFNARQSQALFFHINGAAEYRKPMEIAA
ncbi:hypothetical protein GCM10025867_49350 (plasmid) [Frondihabitans sucicola]|uniref:Uncharacterized protein n=1 Tax=Frondihabitans sucicola TaxID=1268041 RepID=A0ABN6Y5V9_9MICO|nr:hypothetical protein [Frondihabitans sucicola]BDZ52694.1 hypothetical protein GCM10025867_49350 [Frondihabitans sucicola]